MSGWPAAKLGDVAEFLDHLRRPVTQKDRVEGPYPYFGANGQQGTIDGFLFDEELLLLAEDGGHFENPSRGIAYTIAGKSWVNNHAHVLRPRDGVDLRYLCRVLENMDVRPFISGTTRAKLTKGSAAGIQVPLPPLAEQRRIAAILDHADTLRAKRREALARLDELTQSIFIDMFGDPASNDRGWSAGFVSDFVDGFEGGRNIVGSDDQDDGYRVLKVSAVTSLAYRESESKPLPSDYIPPSNHLVREGDLLFSRANTSELVGATAIVTATDGKTALPDKLWRFRWRDESAAVPRYVESLFQRPSFRRKLSERATGSSGSMKNIAQAKVLTISVGIPPLELQRDFAQRKAAIELMKEGQRTALAEFDALFTSLQSRAFRGER
ncbi:restriction endonuclease subunit S [Rhodococcus sp. NPDC060090]|uniref:restriction endonuclease subunit S n=1 Tax=Rhodococcus sp. NPDC060090 TaxID=3347056 RepID=UPI0036684EFB